MFNATAILTALACDNVPRTEVEHGKELAVAEADGSVPDCGPDAADGAGSGERDSRLGVCAICDAPITVKRGDPLAVWRACNKCDED